MVFIVSRIVAQYSRVRQTPALAAAAFAVLALGACASDNTAADAPAEQASAPSGELAYGGALGGGPSNSRFATPATQSGTPDLNTVPREAPEPRSTQEERDEAAAGLIADRNNARYSDQGGRTMPVAVRPLVDTPATAVDAVARLDAPPPPRPAEAQAAAVPLPTAPVVESDIGPRSPGLAPRRSIAGNDTPSSGSAASPGGFRPLGEFQNAVYSRSSLAGTLTMIGGNLTPNDRNVLNVTARDQIELRGKGVIRIVGHGTGGMERAIMAGNELARLGVARNNIYVGVDNISGPTEVFLDRAK